MDRPRLPWTWTGRACHGRGHRLRPPHRPLVTLYVNGYNAPALATYDRVGFDEVGRFATVLF
ncbi:GNAT family N-acetyltransferase [Mobilicoccus caccae]|uniref:GNAT family N-acetyltransferase n=1 Tax=Mobilicoccus caccae TaxID=1859295 RepID=UPI0024E17CDE|nr:hypothetical protein [Mobilicoccus caccae]